MTTRIISRLTFGQSLSPPVLNIQCPLLIRCTSCASKARNCGPEYRDPGFQVKALNAGGQLWYSNKRGFSQAQRENREPDTPHNEPGKLIAIGPLNYGSSIL